MKKRFTFRVVALLLAVFAGIAMVTTGALALTGTPLPMSGTVNLTIEEPSPTITPTPTATPETDVTYVITSTSSGYWSGTDWVLTLVKGTSGSSMFGITNHDSVPHKVYFSAVVSGYTGVTAQWVRGTSITSLTIPAGTTYSVVLIITVSASASGSGSIDIGITT